MGVEEHAAAVGFVARESPIEEAAGDGDDLVAAVATVVEGGLLALGRAVADGVLPPTDDSLR